MKFSLYILTLLSILQISCSTALDVNISELPKAKDLIDQGVIQLEHGYTEQAYASFEMAFESYPLAEALDGMGCVELYKNNLELAEKFFIMAVDLDNNYGTAFGHLAQVYELKEMPSLADKYYQLALSLEPGDVRIRNNHAAFLYDLKNNSTNLSLVEEDALKITIKSELLRANSLTNSDIIKDNFSRVTE